MSMQNIRGQDALVLEPQKLVSREYTAFISYCHSKNDRKWATWLHEGLETFRTPKSLTQKGVKSRIGLVFRDEVELNAAGDLNEAIREALRRSKFLIVICSRQSAQSKWVNAEISYFRELGRSDNILPLLIEGTPEQSFPPSLRELDTSGNPVEPLAADLNASERLWSRARRKWVLHKLLAPMLECGFDDLRQRERERANRRSRILIATLVLAVVAAALWRRSAAQERLRDSIAELGAYSQDSLAQDPARSVVLSRIAFERSSNLPDANRSATRLALEKAIASSPLRAEFQLQDGDVRGLDWNRNGVILAGGYNGSVKAWDRPSQKEIRSRQMGAGIDRIQFSPDSRADRAAIVDKTRILRIWNLTNNTLQELDTGASEITLEPSDVSWCRDSNSLATSYGANAILIVSVMPARITRRVTSSQLRSINAVSFSGHCDELAVGGLLGLFRWQREGDKVSLIGRHGIDAINVTSSEAEGVLRIAWNADGRHIATAGQDRTVRIWDLSGDGSSEFLSGHTGAVNDIAWSGSRLATASADGTVRVWAQGAFSALYKAYTIHTGQARCWSVAWGPTGEEIASGGERGSVRVWHVAVGPERVSILGRKGQLDIDENRLYFDGRTLTDSELLDLARQRSVRSLTEEECETYLHNKTCAE